MFSSRGDIAQVFGLLPELLLVIFEHTNTHSEKVTKEKYIYIKRKMEESNQISKQIYQ